MADAGLSALGGIDEDDRSQDFSPIPSQVTPSPSQVAAASLTPVPSAANLTPVPNA